MTGIGITDEAKAVALAQAISSLANEIFTTCISLCIDPDEINLSDPSASYPEGAEEPSSPQYVHYRRLSQACASHQLASTKLAQLNAQG